MKFKKVLAVALAATTAFSSGTAYELLAKTSVSFAASTVAYEKDETFTEDDKKTGTNLAGESIGPIGTNVVLGYTVTDEGKIINNLTTGGKVKVTSIDVDNTDKATVVKIPSVVTKESEKAQYYVTEVELDGSSYSLDEKVTFDLSGATNLEKITIKNFENDNVSFNLPNTSDGYAKVAAIEKVDFSNSYIGYDDVMRYVATSTDKLKDLNLENLGHSKAKATWDLRKFTLLKNVNVSNNDTIETLKVQRGKDSTYTVSGSTIHVDATNKPYAMKLNISNDSEIKTLDVQGSYYKSSAYAKGALEEANKGVTFITDGSDESTRTADLSSLPIETLTINGAGIEGLILPSDVITADVHGNMITSLDCSAASSMKELRANDNMLIDLEVGGCSELKTLDVSNNFLTSLDVSGNEDNLKGAITTTGNYIPKDNYTKASGQASLGTQNAPGIFAFGVTGDAGLKSSNSDKASGIVKIGGSANIIAAIVVPNAPEGFMEKYAETIAWEESNANGGAVSLGESGIQGTEYKFKGDGNSYNRGEARIFAYAPITGASEKTAAETVNLYVGGKKKQIAVQAANAVIVSYDTTTNLPANKIAEEGDNAYIKDFGAVFVPNQAAELPASGTVSVKLESAIPKALNDSTAVDVLKGVQLSNWNTAADGSGTSYKFNGKGSGKSIKIAEDTTVYAIYTEKTFGVNFKESYNNAVYNSFKKSGTKPDAMKGLNWGDTVALSANGWTSTCKYINASNSNETTDNTFMTWVSGNKAFEDGAVVFGGKLDVAQKYTDKKGTAELSALWNNGNYTMTLDENSVTLGLKNQDKNTYELGDLGAKVEAMYDLKTNESVPDKKLTAFSSDTGVVKYANETLYASGEGNATVYVYDQTTGACATVAVTVTSDGSANTESVKLADLTDGKAVKADNGQTVKLNSDKKTVTLTKGKNTATVKVNTVTIDGVTYKVTAIAANAFKGMSKIKKVVIGNNVKTIGKLAFANCKNLAKVTMGKNVKKIGAKAFKNDKKLAKVLIKSKKLTKNSTVGSQAFKNTKSGVKFYIAKKAATAKKIKKVIKKMGQPTKATYVKKYA